MIATSPASPLEPTDASSDAALVEAAQMGDRRAFGVLVERHQHLVWTIAYCLTGSTPQSEEVSQETFVMAWSQIGGLRDRQAFKGWLRKIAHSLSMRSHRARRGEPFKDLMPEEEAMPSSEPSPLDQLIEREKAWLVRRALQRIPDVYRAPLVLFYRQDKSVESVAAALDLTEDAVKQRLTRARRLLRDEVLALMEPLLARRRPAGQFTAAVLVAISGVDVGSAKASAGTGHVIAAGRKSFLLKNGAVALVGALVVAAVPWLISQVDTKATSTSSSPGGSDQRRQSDIQKARAAILAVLASVTPRMGTRAPGQDEPASPRVGAPDEPATARPLLEFDFEDGLQPSLFSRGQVVETPPGATSSFCVVGTITSEFPGQHVLVNLAGLNLTFSPAKVLSFDYWASGDLHSIHVTFWSAKAIRNYGLIVRPIVRERWGHAEVRFTDIKWVHDLKSAYEEGSRIDLIRLFGGTTIGGGPLYVDNLKLENVPR